jgi:hypothetical protein
VLNLAGVALIDWRELRGQHHTRRHPLRPTQVDFRIRATFSVDPRWGASRSKLYGHNDPPIQTLITLDPNNVKHDSTRPKPPGWLLGSRNPLGSRPYMAPSWSETRALCPSSHSSVTFNLFPILMLDDGECRLALVGPHISGKHHALLLVLSRGVLWLLVFCISEGAAMSCGVGLAASCTSTRASAYYYLLIYSTVRSTPRNK